MELVTSTTAFPVTMYWPGGSASWVTRCASPRLRGGRNPAQRGWRRRIRRAGSRSSRVRPACPRRRPCRSWGGSSSAVARRVWRNWLRCPSSAGSRSSDAVQLVSVQIRHLDPGVDSERRMAGGTFKPSAVEAAFDVSLLVSWSAFPPATERTARCLWSRCSTAQG